MKSLDRQIKQLTTKVARLEAELQKARAQLEALSGDRERDRQEAIRAYILRPGSLSAKIMKQVSRHGGEPFTSAQIKIAGEWPSKINYQLLKLANEGHLERLGPDSFRLPASHVATEPKADKRAEASSIPSAAEPARKLTIIERALELLRKRSPRPIRAVDLEPLQISRAQIGNLLAQLVRRGHLRRISWGSYALREPPKTSDR
jgi:hypothetical protein